MVSTPRFAKVKQNKAEQEDDNQKQLALLTLNETVKACGIHSLTRGVIILGACTKFSCSGLSEEILCSGFRGYKERNINIKKIVIYCTS